MLMVVGNARILLDFSGHDRARILFLSFPHVFSGNPVSCCSQMQEKTKAKAKTLDSRLLMSRMTDKKREKRKTPSDGVISRRLRAWLRPGPAISILGARTV